MGATELNDGIWLRSNAEAFAVAAGPITIKLDFMQPARHMVAPEVAYLVIRISGTVNSSAGTDASGFDACKLIDELRLVDKEEVIRISGQGLRLNEMIELGARQQDMVTLAAGAADAARTFRHVVPFWLDKAERERDTCVRLEHFLEGGDLTITPGTALPTGWDGFANGTIRVYALVFDGRKPELKSRLCLREVAMTNQEFTYDINGSLRTAVMHTKLTTTSQTSLAGFTTVNSQTLRYPANFETDILALKYRLQSIDFNANDPILAATPLAIPFITPDSFQKIGSMPDVKGLHLDLGQAPVANSRLFTSVVKDRVPSLAALVAGYANVGDFQAALEKSGKVVSAKGKNAPAVSYEAALARRLPMRVGGDLGI